MANALVSHALKTVWQEPQQDRQFNVGLARLSPDGGVINSQRVLWHTVKVPKLTGRKWFHVYQVGQVPARLLDIFLSDNQWLPIESLCETQTILVDLYLESGAIIPRSKVWIMKDFTNNILIAIEHDRKIDYGTDVSIDKYSGAVKNKKINLDNSNVIIRFYSNAEFTNISFRDQAMVPIHPIQMNYKVITDQKTYNTFIQECNKIIGMFKKRGMGIYYNDGFVTNYPTTYNSSLVNKTLGFMWDESFKFDMFFDIKDLPVFTSKVDTGRNKYLLLTDEVYDIIDYHDDIDFYLVKRKGKTFKGVYISRIAKYAFRMVTHSAYAIDVELLQYYSDTHDFLADLSSCSVYMMVRQGGKHSGLLNQKNRIEELYKIGTKTDIKNAMVEVNALVPEWNAVELEYSAYCALMQANFNQIDLPLVQKAYGYSATTAYMTPPITSTKRLGRLEQIEVPPGLVIPDITNGYAKRSAFCYDVHGKLISYFSDASSDVYINVPIEITGTKWVELFNGITSEDSGIYVNQDVTSNDLEQYGFRCYASTLYAQAPAEDWEDITNQKVFYTFTPGDNDTPAKLQWNWNLLSQAGLIPAVKTNAHINMYTMVYNRVNDKDGAIDLVVNSKQYWSGLVKYRPQKIPPAQFTVFANGQSLIEDIDYYANWPTIVIVNKAVNALDHVEIIVRSYGCGYPVESGKATTFKPREVGFVKNGRLSGNGNYDVHNDKNIRIVVEGKFRTIGEVNFHEDDVGPLSREGAPYCIEDYILPVEPYTQGIRTNEFYLECVDIEDRVGKYISKWQPQRSYGRSYVEKKRWEVISPVLTSMLYAISNGYAIDANTNENFDSLEVEFWLSPWKWLLEYDPAYRRVDTGYIHIAPHPFVKLVTVTQKQYELLEAVIKLKLNNLVDLSRYVIIKK